MGVNYSSPSFLVFYLYGFFFNTGNKVSCSDNLGSGIEGSTLIKPCYNLNDPYGFTQGRKTYTCSNKSWKLKADECLSVAINNVLTEAEVTFMSFLEVGVGRGVEVVRRESKNFCWVVFCST